MRRSIPALWAALAAAALSAHAAGQEGSAPAAAEPALPRDWLVLPPIDARGRRPFRPDALLARIVLGGETPHAGDSWKGETGEAVWGKATLGDDGRLATAADEEIAGAFGELDVARSCVRLLRANGAGTVLVDDVPYAGDSYAYGWPGVPVALSAGHHRLLVTGLRGTPQLALEDPAGDIVIGTWDATLPSLVRGGERLLEGAVPVMEASGARSRELRIVSGGDGGFLEAWGRPFRLAALECAKLPVPIAVRSDAVDGAEGGKLSLRVRVERALDGAVLAEARLPLAVVEPGELNRRTFRSRIDDSVQEYCVLPPSEPRDPDPRLLLTLHGAGVQAWGQAASYAALPDFWHVAPTNRRPFGFDWQDWGRADAYEVLAHALVLTGVPRERVVLAGHSMGGHGTWHLAANDPDGFAAAAPSAGWRSFDTYGGRPAGKLSALWHAADATSDTEALVANLVQMPLFVLHGGADDNVPVTEAEAMVELLRQHGGDPELHVEPGKGHWWDAGVAPGADCLTWPGIYALFRKSVIPRDPPSIDFTTVAPVVDAEHFWVRLEQPLEYGKLLHVTGSWDPATDAVSLTTENVRRLVVHPRAGRRPRSVELDGTRFEGDDLAPGAFLRDADGWHAAPPAPAGEKRPERSGPLKRAFDHGFVLVVPTGGDAEEDRAAFERARYDAEVWAYRGNGLAQLVRDAELLAAPERFRGRDLVLYGNADTNRAWASAVPDDAPVGAARGSVRLRDESWSGEDLGLLAVLPRKGEDETLVALCASSGPRADRAAASLALFVSGVGYPDYVVYGVDVLTAGDEGVRAAGFFDQGWR